MHECPYPANEDGWVIIPRGAKKHLSVDKEGLKENIRATRFKRAWARPPIFVQVGDAEPFVCWHVNVLGASAMEIGGPIKGGASIFITTVAELECKL